METLRDIEAKIIHEDRTLYELVGVESSLTNNESQDLYEKVGVVLVTTNKRYLKRDKISTPKVLYLDGKELMDDDYDDEDELEDGIIGASHLFLDICKTTPFGVIMASSLDIGLYGAGMGMENSGILTFYSDVNSKKYSDIWKEWNEAQGNEMRYYIYEVWIKKIICDIQRQINTDLLFEMIIEKVEMLKKNNYSKTSIMYRDIQFNLDMLLHATYMNHNITRYSLIRRFGDIASEESMRWLKDMELCKNFNHELDKYSEYSDEEREPETDEEKWIDHFMYNEAYVTYSSKEISRRFDKYYEEYSEK